jgi:hypothetical protein
MTTMKAFAVAVPLTFLALLMSVPMEWWLTSPF